MQGLEIGNGFFILNTERMKFLEKDLEQIIFESDQLQLCERGLDPVPVTHIKKRQLKIGNYGIADIVTYSKPFFETYNNINQHLNRPEISIFELKKDCININTFLQAVRYVKGVMRWIEKIKKNDPSKYHFNIVLVGSKISKSSDFIYLSDVVSIFKDDGMITHSLSVHFYTYSYDLDGLTFKNHSNYQLKDEGF